MNRVQSVTRSTRRRGWWAAFLSASLLAGCSREEWDPPNVLLISLDTLRSDHLGAYDYERDTSPFMDDLASRGMLFRKAFVNCHPTPPSHATILSSSYQETHKLFTNRDVGLIRSISEDISMVQEVLQDNGYATFAVTGGGFTSHAIGFNRGFDTFVEKGEFKELFEWLDARGEEQADEPVFAFLHTYEIHAPYNPPKRYRNIFGEYPSPFIPTAGNLLEVRHDSSQLTREDIAKCEALYDGGIRYTDEILQRLFKGLEERGFLSNAVVIITSDHGEEFGDHGGMLHPATKLYDELIAVPLILFGSGIPEGEVVDRLVSSIDIAPTILEVAGLDPASTMMGTSLLTPRSGEDLEVIVSQWEDRNYSVRTPEWKLIIDRKGEPGLQLFDLLHDPEERRDVAVQYPDQVEALERHLALWKAGLDQNVRPGEEVRLSEETVDRLRELGYVR